MKENVTYGIGGFNPEHPNGNVIERSTDDGDGTGLRTTYDEGGEETGTVELTGLPIDDPDSETAILEAVSAARSEVASLSPTGPTRMAVTALCDAVEILVQGSAP